MIVTKFILWSIAISAADRDLPHPTMCPRPVQPAVISISDDSFSAFEAEWDNWHAVATTSLIKLRESYCFPFLPLERFEGVTLDDFETEVLEKWAYHKQLAVTQSHYDLYMKYHKKNLVRPPHEQQHLLVFEEDARCVSTTLLELSDFLQRLLYLRVKWDIIYIGGDIRDYYPLNSTGGEWLDVNDEYWRPHRIHNIEAILINSQALEKSAELLKPSNQKEPRACDTSLSYGIETGQLIGLIQTQRSCVQPKNGRPYGILFRDHDRRWRANINRSSRLLPMHSEN